MRTRRSKRCSRNDLVVGKLQFVVGIVLFVEMFGIVESRSTELNDELKSVGAYGAC